MLINNEVVSTTFFYVEHLNCHEISATVGNTLNFKNEDYSETNTIMSILIIVVSFLCRLSN